MLRSRYRTLPWLLVTASTLAATAMAGAAETNALIAAQIVKAGGEVRVDFLRIGWPIVEVKLQGPQITDKEWALVRDLAEVRTLYLSHSLVTDDGLAHLARLKELRNLLLEIPGN